MMIKKKELYILIAIVMIDLTTKLLANSMLPFKEHVFILDNVMSFYLTYNQNATGEQAQYLIDSEKNKNLSILISCINGLILLIAILLIRRRKLRIGIKIGWITILFVFLTVISELIKSQFDSIYISSKNVSIISKFTGLILYGTIFYLTKNKWIRLSTLVILAGGFGNLISHFYKPFYIIDFIYISGLYDLFKIGVFNLADLTFDIGSIGFVISLVLLIFDRIYKRRIIN